MVFLRTGKAFEVPFDLQKALKYLCMYEILIRAVLKYAFETWTVYLRQMSDR
jgi:hypothetical protein